MTNTVQSQKNNKAANGFLIVSFITFALIFFLGLLFIAYQHGDTTAYSTGYELGSIIRGIFKHAIIKNGIGLGSLLAVLTSWERNRSITWAIVHAFFGWCYVLYYLFTRRT